MMSAVENEREILVRRRHLMVVLLTLVTGAADALGFLALGGAFSSVMTGNMVLLGISAGTTDGQLAIHAGSALISYIMGVLLGSYVAGAAAKGDPVWPKAVSRALWIELIALAGVLVAWEVLPGQLTTVSKVGLLMIVAAGLGIQSSAVQRFGVPGLSSTYLTGTLTTLIGGLAARKPLRQLLPSAEVLAALIVGAAIAAFFIEYAPRLLPLILVLPLAAVLAISSRFSEPGVR